MPGAPATAQLVGLETAAEGSRQRLWEPSLSPPAGALEGDEQKPPRTLTAVSILQFRTDSTRAVMVLQMQTKQRGREPALHRWKCRCPQPGRLDLPRKLPAEPDSPVQNSPATACHPANLLRQLPR